jgi:cell division septum initiation protein DivIVA
MTRSEFDDIRAYLTAEETRADDLLQVAKTLVEDLEHAKMREATLRAYYLRLLTAARATVAAEAAGAADPLTFVKHELAKHGQLPADGETVSRILSDARTAAALVAGLERTPVRTLPPTSLSRRCAGVSRTTQR